MAKTNSFNLEMFKNGKAAQTKLGNPVKFICITNDGKLFVRVYHRNRIIGFSTKNIAPADNNGTTYKYNLNGTKYAGSHSEMDLEMVDSYEVGGKNRDPKTGRFIKK